MLTVSSLMAETYNEDPVVEVTVSELVDNAKTYEGKIVQLTGKCTKVNEAIMGKNWIHLRDGTKDDFDLVITSKADVREGTNITIKAIVVLNKDFGSGYFYELILEEGEIVD